MSIRNLFQRLAEALLEPINTAAIVLLGIFTVLWGVWVVVPFWNVFSSAKLYSLLVVFHPWFISPEVFWGCIAIIFGMITIVGAMKRTYHALLFGSIAAGWQWFMMGIFYFIGDWHNTGGLISLGLATYAVFIYLNVRVNYKDDNKKLIENLHCKSH